jgi:hypothetical protein
MLLSSILQILITSKEQAQPKPAENVPAGFDAEISDAAARQAAEELKGETASSAAESAKPLSSEDQPKSVPPLGPTLEGLLEMVTKLKESDQSRFVDFFE